MTTPSPSPSPATELPELPPTPFSRNSGSFERLFTADQMRAHARDALLKATAIMQDAALAAQRESEDTRDAERLDWLEQAGKGTVEIFRFNSWDGEKWEPRFVIGSGDAKPSLREAIDAARGIGTDSQEASNGQA